MFEWVRKLSRRKKPVSAPKPVTVKDKVRLKYEHLYIGKITHYYPKIHVGIIDVEKGQLTVGDILYIQGKKTRFKQKVASIEYNHQKVRRVGPGYQVGIRLSARVREDDDVYILPS